MDLTNSKLIYFDHNIWVNLHQNQVNTPINQKDPIIDRIYQKIKQNISEGKISIISSIINIMEAQQRRDKNSRMSIITFIYDTCDGFFHSPPQDVKNLEILNYFWNFFKKPHLIKAFRDECIGNDFENYLGKFQLVPKDKTDSKLMDKLKKIKEESRVIFNSLYLDFMAKMYVEKNPLNGRENINHHHEIRKRLQNIPDFNKRVKKLMDDEYNYICGKIINSLKDVVDDSLIGILNIHLKNQKNHRDQQKLIQKLPSFYTQALLVAHRNADLKRKILDNDFIDTTNLCIPISYFDVVLAEKSFISLAKQAKLDKIYNSLLISKFEELEKYLDRL